MSAARTRLALRRHLAPAVALLLLGGLGSAVALAITTPLYRSTATVLFTVRPTSTPLDALAGSIFATTRLSSYAALASTPTVLSPVADRLHLAGGVTALAARVTAVPHAPSLTVDIAVEDPRPARAAAIADAVADELGTAVEQHLDRQATSTGSVLETRIITTARPAARPASPDAPLVIALGLACGLAMAVGTALLRASGPRPIVDDADVTGLTGLRVLGRLRRGDDADGGTRLVHELRWTGPATGPVLLVTGIDRRAAADAVALGVAQALARTGRRVLLVCADLTFHDGQGARAERRGVPGLVEVLTRDADPRTVVAPVHGDPAVMQLRSGAPVPNPLSLLASARLPRLLDELREDYDDIVLEGPPLSAPSHATILASVADASLLVVATGSRVATDRLRDAVADLRRGGTPVRGVALTRATSRPRRRTAGSRPVEVAS